MKLMTKHLNTAITKAKQDDHTELVTILEDVKQYAQDHYHECSTRKQLYNLLTLHVYHQILPPETITQGFQNVYGVTVNPEKLEEPKYNLYTGLTAINVLHEISQELSFFWDDKPTA